MERWGGCPPAALGAKRAGSNKKRGGGAAAAAPDARVRAGEVKRHFHDIHVFQVQSRGDVPPGITDRHAHPPSITQRRVSRCWGP